MNKRILVFPALILAMNLGSCTKSFVRHTLNETDKNNFNTVLETIQKNQYDNDSKITLTNKRSSFTFKETIKTERKSNGLTFDKNNKTKKCGGDIDAINNTFKLYCNETNLSSEIDSEIYVAKKDNSFYQMLNDKLAETKIRRVVQDNYNKLLTKDFNTGAYGLLKTYIAGNDKFKPQGYYFDLDGFFSKINKTSSKNHCSFDITSKTYFTKEVKTGSSIFETYSPLFKDDEIKYGSNNEKTCSITMKKTVTFKDYYLNFNTLKEEDDYKFEGNVDIDIFICLENNFLCQLETKIEYKDAKRVNNNGDKETVEYIMSAYNALSVNQDSGKEITVNVDDYHEPIK